MKEIAYASELKVQLYILSVLATIVVKRPWKVATDGIDKLTANMVRYKTFEFAYASVKTFTKVLTKIIPTTHDVANWQPMDKTDVTDLTGDGDPFATNEGWELAVTSEPFKVDKLNNLAGLVLEFQQFEASIQILNSIPQSARNCGKHGVYVITTHWCQATNMNEDNQEEYRSLINPSSFNMSDDTIDDHLKYPLYAKIKK